MVTEMKVMRTDDPKSNPRLQADPKRKPRRDHRTLRADAADPRCDAADRLRARQDEALAGIRDQHKTTRRGFSRDDLRQGPSKPESAPKAQMDADTARQAAHASIKAASRKGGK